MTGDLLTPAEAAQALGCVEDTVNAMLADHALPGVKFGRSWRIPRAALIEHLNSLALQNLQPANKTHKAVALRPVRRAPNLPSLSGQA